MLLSWYQQRLQGLESQVGSHIWGLGKVVEGEPERSQASALCAWELSAQTASSASVPKLFLPKILSLSLVL